MGYMTRVDSNGDAEGNFTLVARKFVDGKWGLHPVGSFFLNQNTTGLPVWHMNRLKIRCLRDI